VEPNPRVPDFLRAVTWVECGVVASAALLLLTTPKRGGQDIWAWITPPLNARYVGVIYLAALVALLVFAVHGRWNPGRLVLWEIFVFTTAIMVVMLAYAGRFEWARVATWVFWPLYLFLPVNSAVFLWRLRRADPGRRRAARQRSTRECSGRHDSVTGWPISQRSDAWETWVFCSSATIRVSGPSSTITCVVVPT
jgi:hypothetical protein